jgi:hypothetical protein
MPTDLDQSKRGLQDDHDPSDIGQKLNDKPKGNTTQVKKPAGAHNRDKESGAHPPDSDAARSHDRESARQGSARQQRRRSRRTLIATRAGAAILAGERRMTAPSHNKGAGLGWVAPTTALD